MEFIQFFKISFKSFIGTFRVVNNEVSRFQSDQRERHGDPVIVKSFHRSTPRKGGLDFDKVVSAYSVYAERVQIVFDCRYTVAFLSFDMPDSRNTGEGEAKGASAAAVSV